MEKRTRRLLIATLVCLLGSHSPLDAKVYIDIGLPETKRLPIAVPPFNSAKGEAAVIASKVTEVIVADLEKSGILNILDKALYPVDHLKTGFSPETIDFKLWSAIGAEALVKGTAAVEGQSLTVDARLYDVTTGKQVMASKYKRDAREHRKMAHIIADDIIAGLTGEKGVFNTKIAFVSNLKGNKEIYLMDYDGEGVEALTLNSSINISPAWSPDGSAVSYLSFREGNPAVYIIEIGSGKEIRLPVPEGTPMGASWSPDGQRLAMVVSRDGNADIYLINRDGSGLARLTDNWGLDVSPAWSPNGKEMAFVSDRGGNPQIYIMDSSGRNVRRLTFEGKYNASPAWSPRGDRIAFAGMGDGKFDIFTITADGGGAIQLTGNTGNNESPSWSPDGRFISFSSTRDGITGIYIMHSDGTGQKKIFSTKGSATNPVWGPRIKE